MANGKRVMLAVLAGLIFLCQAQAGEQNVNPGINTHYHDPDYRQWQAVFESPGREIYRYRQQIVESMQLEPGMHVADVGAGTGFLSLLMAERVGEQGKVYAVDIAQNFVDNIRDRARQQGLYQVTGVVNREDDVALTEASIDKALICDTYHHFEYPRSMMISLHKALRKEGEVIIIDFRKVAGLSSDWVMGHVRLNKKQVIKEVEKAGFSYLGEENLLRYNYFLRFKKQDLTDR